MHRPALLVFLAPLRDMPICRGMHRSRAFVALLIIVRVVDNASRNTLRRFVLVAYMSFMRERLETLYTQLVSEPPARCL